MPLAIPIARNLPAGLPSRQKAIVAPTRFSKATALRQQAAAQQQQPAQDKALYVVGGLAALIGLGLFFALRKRR